VDRTEDRIFRASTILQTSTVTRDPLDDSSGRRLLFKNFDELSTGRMEEFTRKTDLRDADVSIGIVTDKLLALTGQVASVQIANLWMPSAHALTFQLEAE
jgi:hypothetical protein